MFIRKVSGIVVLMAIDTAKGLKVTGGRMAFCTLVPFPIMFSTENREIQLVMLREVASRPAGLCGMADNAICREISCLMIRAGSTHKITRVAGKTIRGCILEIPPNMAFCAVVDLMSLGQREEKVVGRPCSPMPVRTGRVVAGHTIR